MSNRLKIFLAVVVVLVGFGIYAGFVSTPGGPRDGRAFDPDRTAALEVDMWKAYYDRRTVSLFSGLMQVTREVYQCPRSTAFRIAFHFARAASVFSDLRRDYEQVLPDLEAGYQIAKNWSGLSYDPSVIARAELAWWIARRVAGQNSPEQVGGLIADLNAQLYGVARERVLEASVLRARAGRLRDEGGPSADWVQVGQLLTESYRLLKKGVN